MSEFDDYYDDDQDYGGCQDDYGETEDQKNDYDYFQENDHDDRQSGYFEEECYSSDDDFSFPPNYGQSYQDESGYQEYPYDSFSQPKDPGQGKTKSEEFNGKTNTRNNENDPKCLKQQLAESKRHLGNFLYKQKSYESALLQYSEALHFYPEAKLYSNRSACYMMLSKYEEAIKDARSAIVCDKTFVNGYIRLVKCFVLTGDYTSGFETIEQFLDVHPNSGALKQLTEDCKELKALDNLIGTCYANREYKNVLVYLNKALKIATASKIYKTLKTECESLVNEKDYYKILGVSEGSSLYFIKAAFKKKARLHHPDKHPGTSEEQKKCQEEQFKLSKEAFDALSINRL